MDVNPVPYTDPQTDQTSTMTMAVPLAGPDVQELPAVSLAPVVNNYQPSPEIAARRAGKAERSGVSNTLDITMDDMRQRFYQGEEDSLRKELALKMDVDNGQRRITAIKNLIADPTGAAPADLMAELVRKPPTDPDMVLENKYVSTNLSALSTAATSMGGTAFGDHQQFFPKETGQTIADAESWGTKREFLQTQLENTETVAAKQGWTGYLIDQAKNLSQVYQEVKLRGNIPGVGYFSKLGLGSNIKEQADRLFDMSNEEFKRVIVPVLNKMREDNPSLAKEYIEALMGQSDAARLTKNVYSVFAIPDVYAGIKIPAKLAARGLAAREVKHAVDDILEAGKKPNATASDITAAAGDLDSSAVQKVSGQVVEGLNNTLDPTKPTMEAMTSNFKSIIGDIGEGAPKNREKVVRLQQQLTTDVRDIPATIAEANKVERTGLAITSQENINALKNEIRSDYRGPHNDLLDVLYEPSVDYDAFTNTHSYRLHIGYDGKYFSNPKTAANYAKDNGLGNVRIVSGEGAVVSENQNKIIDKLSKAEKALEEYQRIYKELGEQIKKGGTPEEIKDLRERRRITKEAGIDKKVKEVQDLRLKSERPENAQRLSDIKAELASMRDKEKIGPVNKPRIAELEAEARAINYGRANALRDTSPAVRQQGVGYYIEVRRPLNETQSVIRDLMIKDAQQQTVKEAVSTATEGGATSWLNAFIGKFRSPEDTLSALENRQRKAAVYSQAVLQQLGDRMGQHIEDLARGIRRFDEDGTPLPWWNSRPRYYLAKPFNLARDLTSKVTGRDLGSTRSMFKEWERAIDFARRDIDPVTKQIGYFKRTQNELDDFYLRTFQRMPSYAESLAYFSKVQLDEYNRVLTNIAVYRNKTRLGVESHSIAYTDGVTRTTSAFIDGVQKKEFPGGDGNIAIVESSGKSRVYSLGSAEILKKKPDWEQGVLSGKYKVFEIYDPEARPLNGFANIADQRIQYVLSDAVESRPISYDQVNRRGGGHFDYEYDHYLKQAIVRPEQVGNTFKHHYEGDTSVMALPNRIIGKDIGNHMNVVRELIKDERIDEARVYARDKLMMEFDGDDGIWSWFKPGRYHNGKPTQPRLNLHEDFHVVDKGRSIVDLPGVGNDLIKKYADTFSDGTRHGSLARQFQVQYTKERDAFGLTAPIDVGTKGAPLYKYEPAKLVDAMPTMNRALNNAIKGTFMDDYKIFAIEHWLREAEPYLKEDTKMIRSSPFYHFNNPDFRPGTPKDILNNLNANKYKIQQFVGVPNEFDTTVHALTQRLADSAYEKYGGDAGRLLKDTTIVPIWMLQHISDPVTKLRSITFNAKLGLFNLPQLLVQAQTFSNIWALAGRNGGAGTYAALLHRWSRFGDEAFLNHLDDYAGKINFFGAKWKPGEFAEARKELAKTGFEHVGGEFAVLDDAFTHKFVKNDTQKFLDLGQAFFREGERQTRLGAWYTAYKEFRDVNPVGALTNTDRAKILQRADLLTNNMSRASSSALHGGVLSLTTQFLSYQIRAAELFMGKRLGETPLERNIMRARMLGMYSALYGVPAAVGVTGLPVSEDFRAAAINNGYVVGDNFLSSLFMEGIPSMITALISGGGDYRAGQFYNVGDRYGSQGFTTIKEALRSDNPWWKIIGGAGVTTAVNTITNSDGAYKALVSWVRGDTGDSRFTLKPDDLIDIAKEISSVNSGWRLLVAMNTGKWLSKNEAWIQNVSPGSAAFMALTGLSPQEQDDIFVKTNIKKSEAALQKYAMTKFIEEFHRGIAAKESNNPQQSQDYWRRAFAYLEAAGYPQDKKLQAISIASKGWESRIESANFDFYLKNPPSTEADKRVKTYKKQLLLNDYRKQ